MGDFNCHLGINDDNIQRSEHFGNILLHEETNSNGEELYLLCELLHLNVLTTMRHRSTKITWASNSRVSQLDHVIMPINSKYKLHSLQACWTKISTDHKKLTWAVKLPLNESKREYFTFPPFSSYYSKTWDRKALQNPALQNEFETMVETCIKESIHSPLSWHHLSSIACYCAEKLLKITKKDMSEEQKAAFFNYRKALDLVMKKRLVDKDPNLVESDLDFPLLPSHGSIKLLRDAHKALLKAKNNKSKEALDSFLDQLNNEALIPGQRIQLAYDFLRTTKRYNIQLCSAQISIKQWSDELNELAGPKLDLLVEDDFYVKLPPPSFNDMLNVIKSMKNNKTPGLDNVCIEMLKSSPTMCYQLYKLIKHAYMDNQVPSEWQETYSIPIPKIKSPKRVNDYRKLTMCSVGYKIYSFLLMDMLKRFLPPLDFYQSGFMKNRSTDDLCFTLKNILDYRWNVGKTTYVISLDLKKAFDTVKISTLPEIFSSYNVPKYLINRIITSVLTEHNCIFWKGQYTHKVYKATGIKQGCKVSPELFIYILNEIVKRTKDDLQLLGVHLCTGNEQEQLTLPLFLSYADDCYLLSDNITDGIKICEVLLHHLGYYGLSINYEKSKILIKGTQSILPPFYLLLNHKIPVVTTLKVLGTHINSTMHRKSILKPRVSSSIKMFRGLLPYLKKLRASMDLLMKLYVTILVPSLTYGLSSSSMTKENSMTLMRREIFIIKQLANIANPKPTQTTIASLLENKTINRKVSIGRIRYYYHVKRSHSGSLILKSLSYNENSTRRVGRPIHTFTQTLKNDFKKYLAVGLTKSQLDRDYELRDVIKRLTSLLYTRTDLNDDPLPIDLNLYCEQELLSSNT